MVTPMPTRAAQSRGITLLEVMIAIVITAFGVLGLAGLMAKMQVAETDGYQRAQAATLLTNMVERITAAAPTDVSTPNASAYVTGTSAPLGTGDTQPASCATLTGAALDECEWSLALKGAAETDSSGNKVGAMIGARGCIELVTAPNSGAGFCYPATFRVSVIWQGLTPTAAPATACGRGLYGPNDAMRRAIAAQVTVGLPGCI